MLLKTHELSRFLSHLLAASVFSLHIIFCCYSFGSLVYAGNLASYFPLGVDLILLGSISITLIAAFFSSLPIALSGIQNDSLPLYAIVAVSVSSIIGAPEFNSTTLSTVIVSVGFATALSGLILLLLGSLKLGNLICFMPYPVIGGFLAGIGWFLFKGAFSVLLTKFPADISQLFFSANLIQWAPAFLLASVLLILQIVRPHHLQLPLGIIASVFIFYAIKVIAHVPSSTLYHYNLLFHFNLASTQVHQVSIQDFSFNHIAWHAIFSQFNHILTIALLCSIGILLNATSLETLLKQELDFNRELRVAGIGNILSGCVGGMTGYLMLTFSSLNYHVQKQTQPFTRSVAIYTGLFLYLGCGHGKCHPFLHAKIYIRRLANVFWDVVFEILDMGCQENVTLV